MATTFVRFRVDDAAKSRAAQICERSGIDLQTYLSMCISRLVRENNVPFSIKPDETNPGILAMKQASRIAEENGIADMTLDEINAEIAEARKKLS